MTSITLLTDTSCGLCDHAKAVLSRVGIDYPLTITEVPLRSEAGSALANAAGVLFAPGVLINDRLFAHGRLSERKLRHHLSKLSFVTS